MVSPHPEEKKSEAVYTVKQVYQQCSNCQNRTIIRGPRFTLPKRPPSTKRTYEQPCYCQRCELWLTHTVCEQTFHIY